MLLLSVVAVVVCPGAPAARAAATGAPEPCRACLLAGAASRPLRVPTGTPLGGYGSASRRRLLPALFERGGHAVWFKSHTAIRDPLRVRALVLDDGTTRVVWVTLDAVAVDRSFTERVRSALAGRGGPAATVIVSASHTHSGPGAFLDSWLMGMVAADALDPSVRDVMVEDVLGAVGQAEASRVPAGIATTRVSGPPVTKGRLGASSDPDLVVMKVATASGVPVALVWNYAIHGTMLPPRNLELSGDVMGLVSNTLERELGVPALFVNGAVGDASPVGHGREAMERTAVELTAAVRAAWHTTGTPVAVTPAAKTTRAALPAPALSLRNCLTAWLPRALRVPLGFALADSVELTAVALGDTVVVTVPGELQGRLGETLKRAASPRWPHAMVAGLSNDYVGYFVTARDYDRTVYVTCAALYGREGGERLTAAAVDLLRSLDESTRPAPGKARRRAPVSASSSGARGETTGERGLLASGGVRVDDALRDGLVEGADRLADGLRRLGAGRVATGGAGDLARRLDGGANARADGPVAQAPTLALTHLLHRRLRVGHSVHPPSRKVGCRAASCPKPARIAT